jgi:hypothetical protein
MYGYGFHLLLGYGLVVHFPRSYSTLHSALHHPLDSAGVWSEFFNSFMSKVFLRIVLGPPADRPGCSTRIFLRREEAIFSWLL